MCNECKLDPSPGFRIPNLILSNVVSHLLPDPQRSDPFHTHGHLLITRFNPPQDQTFKHWGTP